MGFLSKLYFSDNMLKIGKTPVWLDILDHFLDQFIGKNYQDHKHRWRYLYNFSRQWRRPSHILQLNARRKLWKNINYRSNPCCACGQFFFIGLNGVSIDITEHFSVCCIQTQSQGNTHVVSLTEDGWIVKRSDELIIYRDSRTFPRKIYDHYNPHILKRFHSSDVWMKPVKLIWVIFVSPTARDHKQENFLFFEMLHHSSW